MNVWTSEVYFSEIDYGGVVYFANYLKYLDTARVKYFDELNFSFEHQREQNKMFAVANIEVRYLKSLKLGECFSIHTKVKEIKLTSMILEQEIFRESTLILKSDIKIAYLDFNRNMRPIRIPSDLLQTIEKT